MATSAQIAANFETIRQRVGEACDRADRQPDEITIIGASKSQPLERLRWAWEAGLRVYGENRVQEALGKMSELPDEIEWHLLGPLQSNKARKVAPVFAAVHAIDRLKIAKVLDREASQISKPLFGFLEINLAEEDSKHGFLPGQLMAQLPELHNLAVLEIVGLMAIPPFESDPQNSRKWFGQLRELRDRVFSAEPWSGRPGFLSMGMSHDFDVAVEEGATHVRIGTSLFGPRGI